MYGEIVPDGSSPTARALLALEVIQNNPGIGARSLGRLLGVTERAVRRYAAVLREAGVPVESVSGRYGGYRIGRGLRIPPLMFTTAEALGLVMAVLEGDRNASDPAGPVGSALAKIVRVLPERLAGPVRAYRDRSGPAPDPATMVSPQVATDLLEACSAARRLRLSYRPGPGRERIMEVDPWAVVLRHSRWYLLGWSHTARARRVLRVDRVTGIEPLPDRFTPPRELDPLRVLEEHLSQGWAHPVEVIIEASAGEAAHWIPRSLGRLEASGETGSSRLVATTDNPDWYARQLAAIPAPFRVVASGELRRAVAALGARLVQAGSGGPAAEPGTASPAAEPGTASPAAEPGTAPCSAAGGCGLPAGATAHRPR
jgi:predicted DNA-binding transcriptional regulator YafY